MAGRGVWTPISDQRIPLDEHLCRLDVLVAENLAHGVHDLTDAPARDDAAHVKNVAESGLAAAIVALNLDATTF